MRESGKIENHTRGSQNTGQKEEPALSGKSGGMNRVHG